MPGGLLAATRGETEGSGTRWRRYAGCLVDHPALPLLAWVLLSAGRLVDSVSTRFRLLTRTLNTLSKAIIRLAFPLTSDRVLVESYRRLIRRELLDRLSQDHQRRTDPRR